MTVVLKVQSNIIASLNNIWTSRFLDISMCGLKTFIFKYIAKPKIQGPSKKYNYGILGQWANLTCAVVADPPARFEWYFGDRGILFNSNERLIFSLTENVSILQVNVFFFSKGFDKD